VAVNQKRPEPVVEMFGSADAIRTADLLVNIPSPTVVVTYVR